MLYKLSMYIHVKFALTQNVTVTGHYLSLCEVLVVSAFLSSVEGFLVLTFCCGCWWGGVGWVGDGVQWQIQDFLLGGVPTIGGCQPLMQALFGKNICKNKIIGSHWGCALVVPPSFESANGCMVCW